MLTSAALFRRLDLDLRCCRRRLHHRIAVAIVGDEHCELLRDRRRTFWRVCGRRDLQRVGAACGEELS